MSKQSHNFEMFGLNNSSLKLMIGRPEIPVGSVTSAFDLFCAVPFDG